MIERKKYLEMCQMVSALKNSSGNMKKDVPSDLLVSYENVAYYPVSYELSFANDGTVKHGAILHDLKANSIIKTSLERVEKYGKEGTDSKN